MANEIKSVSLISYSINPSLTSSDNLVLTNKGYVDGLWGLNNWSATTYSDGALVVHNGKIYKANGAKTASDTISPNGTGSGWSEVTLETVFSSMGSTYSEGTGIDITNNTISLDVTEGTGIDITNNTISLDVDGAKTALGITGSFQSAAYKVAGTSAGNVLLLDNTGKIPTGVLPNLSITNVYSKPNMTADAVKTGTPTGRYSQATVEAGDIVIESGTISGTAFTKTWMYVGTTANQPTVDDNWREIKTDFSAYASATDLTSLTTRVGTLETNAGTHLTSSSNLNASKISSGTVGISYLPTDSSVSDNSNKVPTSAAVYSALSSKVTSSDVSTAISTAISGAIITTTQLSGKLSNNQLPGVVATISYSSESPNATVFNILHSLGTSNVVVQIYKANELVLAEIKVVDTNNIKIRFAGKLSNGDSYKVVVYPVCANDATAVTASATTW